jgi:hypothetical protein
MALEDNMEKIARIGSFVKAYAVNCGLTVDPLLPEKGDTMRTALVDVIADIRHYCHQYEMDFDNIVELAKDHWWAELKGLD